jgi:hypothetical protein
MGTGDVPSPTTATGPTERSEVAPLIELRAPASIRAARVAIIHFFRCFTLSLQTRSQAASRIAASRWVRSTYIGPPNQTAVWVEHLFAIVWRLICAEPADRQATMARRLPGAIDEVLTTCFTPKHVWGRAPLIKDFRTLVKPGHKSSRHYRQEKGSLLREFLAGHRARSTCTYGSHTSVPVGRRSL